MFTDFEVRQWPKTARLISHCTISEKLDGSNCAVVIERSEDYFDDYDIGAQTRTKIATEFDDQLGFYRWVEKNELSLIRDLGPGYHYGEFVKGKGLKEPHFFLFNTKRWADQEFSTPTLDVVPVLFEGDYSDEQLEACLKDLETNGSKVLDTPAEGVIVFWKADESAKKVFCKNQKQRK